MINYAKKTMKKLDQLMEAAPISSDDSLITHSDAIQQVMVAKDMKEDIY